MSLSEGEVIHGFCAGTADSSVSHEWEPKSRIQSLNILEKSTIFLFSTLLYFELEIVLVARLKNRCVNKLKFTLGQVSASGAGGRRLKRLRTNRQTS